MRFRWLSNDVSRDRIDQRIIQIVKEEKPQTVSELVRLVKKGSDLSDEQILDRISYLQSDGRIALRPEEFSPSDGLVAYLRTDKAYWYWITLGVTLVATLFVFVIPEDAAPLVYVRYVFGAIFVLWLPGYTFMKALFPGKELDNIEQLALSVGMSLALVPLVGLLLNYSPWGITLVPITFSLSALTIALATAAMVREHQTKKNIAPR
jgi:hypothetical protein